MTKAVTSITTQQVADHFAVDQSTVRRWASTGRVPSIKTPGGTYRFPEAILEMTPEVDPALANHV